MNNLLWRVKGVFRRKTELRGTHEQKAEGWASIVTIANFLGKDLLKLSEEEYREGHARLAFVDEALHEWQADDDDDEKTLGECAVEAGTRHGFSPEVSIHIVESFYSEYLHALAVNLEHDVD